MLTQNSAADIVSSQWRPIATERRTASPAFGQAADNEFDLLCACCSSDGTLVDEALSRELRWDRVFQQSAYHRVLPALYSRLRGRPQIAASIQSALRARYLRHCQRAMRFSAELKGILQHFQSKQIPVIAQKGPALAHLLYGDSAMRDYGDLDLLVRPSDVPHAVAALQELGYEKSLRLSLRQEKAYLKDGYEYVFGRGDERNLIELQWNLLPRFYSVDTDIDHLFANAREHEVDGCRAQVLSLEDQMLYLCVHAAKHQWAQLAMIRDIAALARMELDWGRVFEQAKRLGVLRMVLVSLFLTEELLGVAVPEATGAVAELCSSRQLSFTVSRNLTAMQEISTESFAYFRFMLHVRERWQDKVRFLWRLASTPSVGEWSAMAIPDALFPLYGGVRFLRLARRLVS